MKKQILSVAILATMTLSQAQEVKTVKDPVVRFGLKAGLNYAVLNKKIDFPNEEQSSSSPRISFHGGVFTNIHVYKKLSFQPEVLLSLQGYNEKYTHPDYINDRKIHLTYINIPLLFQYKIIDQLFVETGPQLGFAIIAKYDQKYFNTTTQITTEQKNINLLNTTQFNKYSFGVNFGLGYNLTNSLFVNIRYNQAISEIDTDKRIHIKNNLIQLGAGYKF